MERDELRERIAQALYEEDYGIDAPTGWDWWPKEGHMQSRYYRQAAGRWLARQTRTTSPRGAA